MGHPATAVVARFFDKVQITKSCWLWIGAKHEGYGAFYFRGKTFRAHRFSYELFVGPIEQGKMVLHRRECDNPSCVNPNHLYMGTQVDNTRDMMMWGNPVDPPNPFRRAYKGREHLLSSVVADAFGVDVRTLYDVVRGVTWKHLGV